MASKTGSISSAVYVYNGGDGDGDGEDGGGGGEVPPAGLSLAWWSPKALREAAVVGALAGGLLVKDAVGPLRAGVVLLSCPTSVEAEGGENDADERLLFALWLGSFCVVAFGERRGAGPGWLRWFDCCCCCFCW